MALSRSTTEPDSLEGTCIGAPFAGDSSNRHADRSPRPPPIRVTIFAQADIRPRLIFRKPRLFEQKTRDTRTV